ncbi:MAG: TerB family tellurite resistance protein [Deltaproteobacteria bacterium]|nr:MAG: TerB family tellurite resistance protein [Deltaproteobacteria bacterium]
MTVTRLMSMIEQDPRLSRAMRRLQLSEETLHLLPIFPLIYVAWADGKLQEEAVEKILEIAEENGLTEGDGSGILSVWLRTDPRPSDAFFVDGLRLTAAILKHTRPDFKDNIIFMCESVAEAVGGWIGVKRTEQEALTQIADLLRVKGAASYHTLIERMKKELEQGELDFIPTHVSPFWVTVNTVLSAGVAALLFYTLWKLYPKLVTTENHETYFLLVLLIVPQVGFFFTNLITARLSSGDTRRESTYGTAIALVLALVAGGMLSNQVAKKYVGYNVARPDLNPMLFPACKNAKNDTQRCVRTTVFQNNTVCRLMPNRKLQTAAYPMGQEGLHWFSMKAGKCKEDRTTGMSLFRITPKNRVVSAGFYPLCNELGSEDRQACILLANHPKTKEPVCRILGDSSAKVGNKLGKKFDKWYPVGRHCSPLYARVFALWTKKGKLTSFYGYRPLCKDLTADQPCLYLQRLQRPDNKNKANVCILSSSSTIPPESVTLAQKAHVNWFPQDECKEVENTQPITYFMAALGFAFFALFSAYFGAWVGVRWQGSYRG